MFISRSPHMSSTANTPNTLAVNQLNAVYFVNSDLADLATLLAGVPEGAEVVMLDPAQDGLNQMLAALEGRSGLDAIHIIGHGASGLIDLGSTSVTSQTLTERAADIASLGSVLSSTGDILLYGCEVGEGVLGAAFVQQLADLTGADVAASTNRTGAAALGGDWVLETQTGEIEAATLVAADYSGALVNVNTAFETDTGGIADYTLGIAYINISKGATFAGEANAYIYIEGKNGVWVSTGIGTTGNTYTYQVADDGAYDLSTGGGVISVNVKIVGNIAKAGTYDYSVKGVTSYGNEASVGPYTASVTIVDPNKAPTANALTGVSVNEDATITGFVTGSDPEGPVTYSIGSQSTKGTASITNAATGAFSFAPAANFYGNTTFTFTVTDTGGKTASNTVSITVNPIKDAPTFTGDATLTAVNEDATAPTGATVSALLFAKFADPDNFSGASAPDTFAGIAITANASTQGTWQYSTDTGTNWFDVGAVSSTTALLLSSAASSILRFVPTVANWNGTPDGLSVLAIDSSGTAHTYTSGATRATYTTADYTATGSVALLAVTLGTTVTAVNDAPVLQNGADSAPLLVTIDENATTNTGNLISTLVRAVDGTTPTDTTKSVVTDVDFATQVTTGGNPNEAWGSGVAIYGLSNTGPADASPGHWEFKLGASAWTTINTTSVNGGSTALLLSSADSIRFVPDTDNATTATVSYYIWDGLVGNTTAQQGTYVSVATRGGSTNYSTASDTATISVTPVNDAPTLDLDGNNSSTATGSSTVAGASFITNFSPRGEEVAVVDTDITIHDVDQTSRTDDSQQDRVFNATVEITGGATDNLFGTTYETLSYKVGGVATTADNGLTITGNGSTKVTLSGVSTWANYQTALQKVLYNNSNPGATTGDRTITVTVKDNNDTAGPNGQLSAVATSTVKVSVTSVIDLNGPSATGANNNLTYTEGDPGQYVATSTAYIDSQSNAQMKSVVLTLSNPLDVTGGASNENLFLVQSVIDYLLTRGITVSGSMSHAVTLTASNSVNGYSGTTYGAANSGVSSNDMQLAIRGVLYVNSSEMPSTTARVVNVTLQDVKGAGVGAKSTISMVPVNDAPLLIGDLAATLLEGGLVTLTTADLDATDVDNAASTLTFVVTAGPTQGVLFRDGNENGLIEANETLAAVPGTGVITSFTQGDIAKGLVKYQQTDSAAGSVNGYPNDSFTFKVQDGMQNGVTAPAGTLAITITPVNDAPTLNATASNPTFVEGGVAQTLFSGSALSAVESGQTIQTLVLTLSGLANGADEKLTINGGAAVSLVATGTTALTGTLIGLSYAIAVVGSTATITLTHTGITSAEAQTLINTLAYSNTSTAPSTNNRVATLVSVQDSGGTTNTGVDTTALSIASIIHITGNDVAPVLALNTGATVANGALQVLTTGELSTTDTDSAASAIVYTVGTTATKGALFLDANGSGAAEGGEALTAGRTFTQADVDAGKVKYRHNGADSTADSFTFTVKDATTTLAPATFNLSITAVGAAGATPSGITGANSSDGSDPLFSGVVVTPGPGNTVKSMEFTFTGVKDGGKEILTLNGQQVPMLAGTITVGDITYAVVANVGGSFHITVTDISNPGWNSTDASAIVNGARYTNTAVPPTAGVRGATLDMVTDWLPNGTSGPSTPVAISTVVTLGISTDLWTLPEAQVAVPEPTAPNDRITTLNFTVTGATNGGSEFIKINGHEVPMTAGTITLNGVSYTVTENGAGSGNFTLAVTQAAGWTEAQTEALLDAATYSNNSNPATAGNRAVTLVSVVEATSQPGGVNPIPSTTPRVLVPALTNEVPAYVGVVSTPLSGASLPVTADSTVDALTFTVAGVKDGASESLTIDGKLIPLVDTTAGTVYTGASGVQFTVTVTVDGNGTATVLIDTPDAPTLNYTQAQAEYVVQHAIYNNSALPPTAGKRDVTLTQVKEETGDGSALGTPKPVVPAPAITGPVDVLGNPTAKDVFDMPAANLPVAPVIAADDTIDSITIGVSGVKDGDKEIIHINGQDIPLVARVTIDANGYTYTVTVDSNGNATLVLGTPSPPRNFTQAEANAIIDGITYTNSANPPTSGARDVTVNNVVKESITSPFEQTVVPVPGVHTNVLVGNVTNTGPVVSVNAGLTVAEGATFTLTATQLAATDVQQAAGSLVFKLVAAPAHGQVFRDNNNNGLVNAGETISVGGTFTQLELTNGSIKYRHDSSETASDQLSFTVSDGITTTTAMPFVMNITRVNDAPTLLANASAQTFTESPTSAPVALFTAATVTTGDTLGTAQTLTTLTLQVGNVRDGSSEKLKVNGVEIDLSGGGNSTAGVVNGTSLSYTIAVSGTTTTLVLSHTGLTAAEVQTLVEGLAYNNTSDNPTSGLRSISITQLVDSGGSTLPDRNTATLGLTSTVDVVATNNAPTLVGGTMTLVEAGAFSLNTTLLAASDVDTVASSFVYRLTSEPTAGLLYVDNNGNALNDAGDTTLGSNSTFTQAELTAGKVRYLHDGNETNDSFQISVSDGVLSSAAVTIAITRTPVNDAPLLANLNGDVLSYPPLSGALLIDVGSNATVTDPDSIAFTNGVLRVSMAFNGSALSDVLSIKNVGTGSGLVNLDGANVRVGTTIIGTFAGGSSGADLLVTLNSNANKSAVEALIHALQFSNSEAAPAVNSRDISISLSDGQGATSLASQVHVSIPVGGPTFLSGSGFYVSENTNMVTVMAAKLTLGTGPIVYSISMATDVNNIDAAKFTIDVSNGTLSFLAAPDFEAPSDSGTNNVYNVVVRASNKEGAYTEAALAVNVVDVPNESGPAPGDVSGPVFGFATVNANTLTLVYTDANTLDAANLPVTSAFAVQVAGNAVAVTSVVINSTSKTVTLALASAVSNGQAVTVAYTDPTTGNDVNAIQDAVGNDAATLVATAVNNVTPGVNTGGGSGGNGGTGTGITDTDGVSDSIENAVSGLILVGGASLTGDGNGDGIADSRQSGVTSMPFRESTTAVSNPGNSDSMYITLVADSKDGKIDTTDANTATLSNVRQLDGPTNLIDTHVLPLGLLSFSANVGVAGTTETFSVYVDASMGATGYFKQDAGGTWVNLASAAYGGKVVAEGGKTRLDFEIKDGGQFDSDGRADGVITDPGGLGFRVAVSDDADHDQFPDALEAANGLTVGVKDNNVFTSSKLFAMQMYRDILFREGDVGGVEYWTDRLDTDLTRAEVAVSFLDSPEFQTGAGGIARLYFGALSRLPDAPGMNYWMDQQQLGTPLVQIAGAVAASPEFTLKYAGLGNTAFVESQYQSVLGRSATAQEQTQWTVQLLAGANRGVVLLGLTDSAEYRAASDTKLSVALDYLGLLGRPAEQGGFDFWVNQQSSGMPEVTVVGGFISSPEFHDRFLP